MDASQLRKIKARPYGREMLRSQQEVFMKRRFKLAALAAVLSQSLAGSAAIAAAPGALERGAALVVRNCSQCHAVGRTGGSPDHTAPPLQSLYRYVRMSDLAQALQQGLLAKHPAMPEFRFSRPELEDIMSYLRAIQEQVETSATPER